MPLQRRLPKMGFNNIFREEVKAVNLKSIVEHFASDEEVSPESLVKKGLLRRHHNSVKILAEGEIKVALTVKAHAFSAQAKAKIEAAGGNFFRASLLAQTNALADKKSRGRCRAKFRWPHPANSGDQGVAVR